MLHIVVFFDDLQLQIIESISPKAYVENSSAQWAIFFIDLVSTNILLAMLGFPLSQKSHADFC